MTVQIKKELLIGVVIGAVLTLLTLWLSGNLTQDGYGVKYWRGLQLDTAIEWSNLDECYTRKIDLFFAKKGCINSDEWFEIWDQCRGEK